MKKIHQVSENFRIDQDGMIYKESRWLICPQVTETEEFDRNAFRSEVEVWAGSVGAPYREGAGNGSGYVESTELVVNNIEIRELDDGSYEINFRAVPAGEEPQLIGGVSYSEDSNGEKSASSRWQLSKRALDAFSMHIGEAIDWAGEGYLCEKINISEHCGGALCEVEMTARKVDGAMLGNITRSLSDDMTESVSARFLVSNDAVGQFRNSNQIGSVAEWMNDIFYITALKLQPCGKLGHYITCEAVEVRDRLLSLNCNAELTRYYNGVPFGESVYTATWRIHRDSLENYEKLIGTTPVGWAKENYIIDRIDTSRLSEIEYEVAMHAVQEDLLDLSSSSSQRTRLENLSGKKEYAAESGEFRLTAKHCGYIYDGGEYKEWDGWSSGNCPVSSSERLGKMMIDKALGTLIVVETVYVRGSSKVSYASSWYGSRVTSGSIGGVTGSWLKESVRSEEILDRKSNVWTKVVYRYRKAPSGHSWNSTFWK